jgi:Na+/H+ antiporter NhaD/arsenite permease-like protein
VRTLDLSLCVFVAVYGVMILGRVPGLGLDRTGAALLGAILLVAGGALDSTGAWRAIDVGTITLLLGLMLVSAQFRRSGSYAWLVRTLAARPTSPERMLGELVVVIGGAAALLTNDVVCLATAPVLIEVCARRQFDPVPFLLGLAAAANVGSAATLLGNPQNMLIGQALDLSFARYLLDGAVPAAIGLGVVWWVLARAYRGTFVLTQPLATAATEPLDRGAAAKGLAVLSLLVLGLLFAPVPHEVQALLAGGAMLLSRRQRSRDLLELVDWQLLVLFAGLFVVNHAFQHAGHAADAFGWLRQHGLDLADPCALFATGVLGSNVVSNVPLTMLLLPVADHPMAGPILALSTTLAGNLLLIGSIANLIVVEQANRLGVAPRGRSWAAEHWRTGVPITLGTLLLAAGWLWLRARMLA